MKKLLFILSFFVSIVSYGQYPNTGTIGSDSSLIDIGRSHNGAIRGGIIVGSFTDTTMANLSRIKFYTGALVWSTSDSSLYAMHKSTTSRYWFKIGSAVGGVSGAFWGVNGTYFAGPAPVTRGIGTNSADELPFKTNGVVRFKLPYDGLNYSEAADDSVIARDINGNLVIKPYTSGGGGGGTVTSVATGYGLAGGTITTTGTLRWDSATGYLTGLRRKDSATGTNLNGYLTRTYLSSHVPGIDDVLSVNQSILSDHYLDGGNKQIHFDNFNGVYIDYFLDIDGFKFRGLTSGGNNTILITTSQPSNVRFGNVGMGSSVLSHINNNSASYNTAIGDESLVQNLTGGYNVAIGKYAMNSGTKPTSSIAIGTSALNLLDTIANIAIGENALLSNVNGPYNVAIGYNSQAATTGGFNTSIGHESLKANTTGTVNVAVGQTALWKNTTGLKNVAVGGGAMENNTIGGFNVAIGQDAILNNKKGGRNVAVGWEPLGHIGSNVGDSSNQNVAIGYLAGDGLYHGDNNTFLGYASGWGGIAQEDTVTNSTAIGAFSYTTASNQIVIGASTNTDFRAFGITNASGNATLTYDTTTKKVTWSTSGGGSTPTFQQTLTAGSTLTGDNTIAGGTHALTINGVTALTLATSTNSIFKTTVGSFETGFYTDAISEGGSFIYAQDGVGGYSDIEVAGGITIRPAGGALLVDTLLSGLKTDSLVVWRKSTGNVRMINAGDLTRQQDTIPLFTFGGGGGQAGDTTTFSTSTIYGSFFNDKSDTLVITKMLIGLQGTSPDVTITVYYNDSLNVTAGATKLVNAGNNATNIYTGTSVTSFDNAKIPPGVWVWCKSTTVATKPTYLTVSLSGYKSRTL